LKGWTALHFACSFMGSVKAVRKFCSPEVGADLCAVNTDGSTALDLMLHYHTDEDTRVKIFLTAAKERLSIDKFKG
jgi:hypothetical protein